MEKTEDLKKMVSAFLTHKGVEYVKVTSVNVKQSNIVISCIQAGGKEKWLEYNLSFLFSFLFQQTKKENPDEVLEAIVRKMNELNNSLKERIDQQDEKIKLLSNHSSVSYETAIVQPINNTPINNE